VKTSCTGNTCRKKEIEKTILRILGWLMTLQRFHHRDTRHHWVTAMLADQHQHFRNRLPMHRLLFSLR